MTANTAPIFVISSNCKGQTFTSADTTAKKDLWIPGSNGGLLRALSFVTDDTAAVNMDLWVYDGSTAFAIGTINIPIGSGTTTSSNAINGLNTTSLKAILAPDGSLFLPTGFKLQGSCRATMTAAKTTTTFAQGGDY